MVLYFSAALPLWELCEEKIHEANLIVRYAHKFTYAEFPEGRGAEKSTINLLYNLHRPNKTLHVQGALPVCSFKKWAVPHAPLGATHFILNG